MLTNESQTLYVRYLRAGNHSQCERVGQMTAHVPGFEEKAGRGMAMYARGTSCLRVTQGRVQGSFGMVVFVADHVLECGKHSRARRSSHALKSLPIVTAMTFGHPSRSEIGRLSMTRNFSINERCGVGFMVRPTSPLQACSALLAKNAWCAS